MGTEKEFYKKIRDYLEHRFRYDKLEESDYSVYLAITSEGKIPEKIQNQVPAQYEIIYSFLKKKNSPDLTGFVKSGYSVPDFVTVEIKNDTITLEDVYQAKRYADLFQAKHGFLISTKPIPTTIRRLCQRIPILNIMGTGSQLKLAQFDVERNRIWRRNWFPESPFRKEPLT